MSAKLDGLRDRLEDGFERWGHIVHARRKSVLLGTLLVALPMLAGLTEIRTDTSIESFLKNDDPVLVTYQAFRAQFGHDGIMVIGVETPDVFDLAFLEKLSRYHEELETSVPHLEQLDSLINARDTRGDADRLIVEDLFEHWPRNEAELAPIRARALSNPVYENYLLSRSGAFTALMLQLRTTSKPDLADALAGFDEAGPAAPESAPWLTGDEVNAAMSAVVEISARYEDERFRIHLAGEPMLTDQLQVMMRRDMERFVALSLVLIAGLLWLLFRRISGVLLPLGVIVLSVGSTLGVMSWAQIPLRLPTQILPSFLMAISVGAAVHLLSIYYQDRARGLSAEEALAHALGHSGLAIAMTSLTTAGGLLSFTAANMAPVADFGVLGPIGALLTLFFTLTFLPAAMSLTLRETSARPTRESRVDAILQQFGSIATRAPRTVVGVCAVLVVISIAGMTRLTVAHDPMSWFPADLEFRLSNERIDQEFQGSMAAEVLIRTAGENGLYEPEVLNRLEELRIWSENFEMGAITVGKANTLTVVVKEIHQALNENRAEEYRIPQDRTLIAQELLLFENTGADDLEDLVDSRFQTARFSMRVPWHDSVQYPPFLAAIEEHFVQELGDGVRVEVTGIISVMSRTLNAVVDSLMRSYVLALLIITPLMVFLIGSVRGGLLSMIPNLFPVVLTLGLMGWVGLPIDLFSLLTGCIAIGLAVDDTIHFMHNFQRYYRQSGDARWAVQETLRTTGRALLFTSVVLSMGFFLYMLASMQNLQAFGFVTGVCIVLAFLADVLLAPSLMVLVRGRRPAAEPDTLATQGVSR